ncbi:sulfatase [Tamlana sp. 2201CG12-4]|uniref:sulfatase n=1 Tax=Tamlana sp. 2201CG12-4 TaxID=3112582 RepID=UPI002DB8F050|nr:sulfatase [Tamlana sp. 2201CG12-4]MEC3907052.1 sulfatase [Tamlana sp. 2201CG12-4]
MKVKNLATVGLILFNLNVFGQKNPNVLFIAIDDLNDYVNCMNGSIKVPTPNIDKLAQKGTLFTNAHCQAPICGPSRASIMTGLYPSTSGNYLQLKDIDIKKGSKALNKAIFMPDYFEQHGYKTMAVGKIYHNGDAANTFDEYGGKFAWMGPKPKERFNYDPSKIDHKVGRTQTDWGAYPEHDSLMTDFKSAKWAVNKLHQKHDKPFFLAVGFVRPHVPWYAPQKWFDMFPLDSIETPPYTKDDFDDIPPFARKVSDAPMMPTTDELIKSGEWKNAVQAYMACIAFVDAQVGKVLDALENSEHADNTVIVLWADHGYHLGEKNRFAKQALWERDTRTLLIFKDVNGNGEKKCTAPVQLLDIYPTLIDMCKLPSLELLEGHSLTKLIKSPKKKWNYPSLSFYGEGNIAIRDKRFRLIKYEDGSLELYDMKNDPNEWNNLAKDIGYKKTIQRLTKYIPSNWAPLSEYSKYNFNEYFIEKSKL